ncbi:MAG TPA: transcription antitermination factor NusB [Acidimicrobiales bacterium]|nr:transcription antitermination factor NusB [Acidimicrobiales bacterium]
MVPHREAGGGEDPRHQARERALALLYESELKGEAPTAVLAGLAAAPDPLARELVEGVAAHGARIDELVASAAVGWDIERMPVVDRSILRLATYELLERLDTPVAVVIDEAVELAKEYSTEQSSGFVNGVLVTIAGRVRPSPD